MSAGTVNALPENDVMHSMTYGKLTMTGSLPRAVDRHGGNDVVGSTGTGAELNQ